MSDPTLKAVVIGCRSVGKTHARSAKASGRFTIVAGCDLDEFQAKSFAETVEGAVPYTDLGKCLAETKPDVVIITTGNTSHAALTIQCADAGARGIYCEKPMAVSYGDAQAMVEACRRNGTKFVINHQRRTRDLFHSMRKAMDEGQIGTIECVRGNCAGDLISDATHLVDTIRFLLHDVEAKWVLGQSHREALDNETPPPDPRESDKVALAYQGKRFGHLVDSGSMGVIAFENGMRAEIFSGDIRMMKRPYHDIEVIGTEGYLRAPGDRFDPPAMIMNGKAAGWQPLPVEKAPGTIQSPGLGQASNYARFADMIEKEASHPMEATVALKNHEILTAVLESCRLRRKIYLPVKQDRYPLDIMVENGDMT